MFWLVWFVAFAAVYFDRSNAACVPVDSGVVVQKMHANAFFNRIAYIPTKGDGGSVDARLVSDKWFVHVNSESGTYSFLVDAGTFAALGVGDPVIVMDVQGRLKTWGRTITPVRR